GSGRSFVGSGIQSGLRVAGLGMLRRTRALASLVPLGLCVAVPARAQNAPTASYAKERVPFKSGKLTLVGFLFRPDKPGPFPGLIWNHRSETDPGSAAAVV